MATAPASNEYGPSSQNATSAMAHNDTGRLCRSDAAASTTSETTQRRRHGTTSTRRLPRANLSLANPAASVEMPPMNGKTELYCAARPGDRPWTSTRYAGIQALNDSRTSVRPHETAHTSQKGTDVTYGPTRSRKPAGRLSLPEAPYTLSTLTAGSSKPMSFGLERSNAMV